MNNKQKLLTATAITGTIVSASAFTVSSIMRSVEEKNSQMSVKKKNGNHILITF